jgi:catechol 2,3-dioxygenase-like lactoylglutathione lyase family enzyme
MSDIAHVSLNVSDLGRAVEFYRALFGIAPAKHYKDYAKFELSDPPLVLSLEPIFHRAADSFNHLGVRLSTAEAVKSAEARLKEAGILADREDDVECCYSRQTKFWLLDPDRNMWEVYALTGEIAHRGSLTSSDALAARDRVGVLATWEHKLGDPVPSTIPVEDGAIEQVRLRGTFNRPLDEKTRRALLAETMRILRPGGDILVHGLAADKALKGNFPRLPGPAALVGHAPVENEPLAWLREAGYVGLYCQKLGERHNFEHDGVRMRELMVVGFRPPAAEEAAAIVIYRGPFTRVVDDEGHEYRAGERVTVDGKRAARLRQGILADQFTFIRGDAP